MNTATPLAAAFAFTAIFFPGPATASPYADAVLADSPLAYFRFDESAGAVAADASGNGAHGTFVDPASLGFGAPAALPNLGSSIDFTGGYVRIPTLGTHARCSVEAWIQFDSTGTDPCCSAILAADGWSLGKLHLNLTVAGSVLEHAVNGDATAILRNTQPLLPGTWYHFVVTNDVAAGETKFYLDGALVADTGDHSTEEVVLGGADLQIGAWDGGRNFDGRIDEFAIYASALSAEQVQEHYLAASDPGTPDILAFTATHAGTGSDVGLALPAGGGTVTLAWEVDDAVTVEIDHAALAPTAAAQGSVDVAVSADTTFTLSATNAGGTSTAAVDLAIDPVPLDPRLTEFMAENAGSLTDGNGASSDWIEIHNPNRFPLDLAGFQLRDTANVWTFPPGSLVPALGYLVVFASGDGAADPAGHPHTDFSLNNAGEELALLRPGGEVIDAWLPFPPQYADISYGPSGYATEPTPGAAGGTTTYLGLLDKTDDTQFLIGRGFFDAAFDETVSATTPGASIIYTTDGSVPSEANGTRVDAPDPDTPPSAVVRIDGAAHGGVTTLRAAVFKADHLPTNVDTQTYIFSEAVTGQSSASAHASGWPSSTVNGQVFDYGMTLAGIGPGGAAYPPAEVAASLEAIPTLSLVTDFDHLVGAGGGLYVNALGRGREWERPTSVELIYPPGYDDPDGNAEGFQIDAGLRIRGGYSRNPQFFKHAFRLFFRGEYGDAKLRFPLFGTEGTDAFDKVDLRSSSNLDWAREADPALGSQFTFARDVFARDTQGAMGQAYTKSRYYHLYLNGTYWGIYQTEERPEAAFGESYFGGDRGDYDAVKCSNHVGGFVTEATDGTLDAFEELWARCREIALDDPSDANFFALEGRDANGVRDPALPVLLDVDNLIDLMLVTFWTGNGDGILSSFLDNNRPNNWFGIRSRTGDEGFRFFAHDGEFTLGSSNTQSDRTGPFTGSNQNDIRYANPQWMHQDLMANAEYRLRFADRVQEHFFRGGALTDAAAIARFTARADQLRPALPAYAARWADAAYAPGYNTGMWEAEIAWITDTWMPGRGATVLDQLRADALFPALASPQFEDGAGGEVADGEVPSGFQLHLGAGAGTVYYTLDGTDPRALGDPAPTVTTTWVDFGDSRAYSVPNLATDGFQTSPALGATPLAYYPFDIDAGDAATADGAQDGTLMNGASISADAHTGAGALLLDGVDDYVTLGDPAALQITGEISIATWVKANAVPSQTFGNILAKGHWLDPNSEIFLRYAAQINSWRVASWDGVVHGTEIAGAAGDIGQWVHLVGTYDGSSWNLYRNGVLGASNPDPVGAIAVPNDWAIGARGTGTERFFDGFIDEVYLFDTALDEGDIQRLYAGPTPEWQRLDYAPAAGWPSAPGGLGYDAGGALDPLIDTDLGGELNGENTSLLTRATFSVAPGELAGIDYLELNIFYDAGFVAYLNGTEVHRVNAPGSLDGYAAATGANPAPGTEVTVDLSRHLPLLNTGTNLLAVHSLNESVDSPDHLVRYRLRAGTNPPIVTPAAAEYTGAITIVGPATISARTFLNGEWSPLASATFHTGIAAPSPENLAVSQIHYHPQTAPGDPRGEKDYEFLELMNIGAQTLDLGGLHLREDIDIDFPAATFLAPGERAQIVSDAGAFAERYAGRPVRVLGEFAGNLSNAGGRLHLIDDTNGTVRDFRFNDKEPWPAEADGDGFSLVLIRPLTNPDHADPANWRRSSAPHGSPGADDAETFTGDPAADGDGDGLSALLEYALGTSDAVPTLSPWTGGAAGQPATIARRVNADDARWVPELSHDLQLWQSGPGVIERRTAPGADPAHTTESYRPAAGDPGGEVFFRVRVELR